MYLSANHYKCREGWERFGGSCYYLSNVSQIISEVNKTCNETYLNNSQLMKIEHIGELFYAAHYLMKHDLSELLIEINSHSIKGKSFK